MRQSIKKMQMYKEDHYSHSVVEEEYMFKDEHSYSNGSTMHMMKPPAEHCLPKHSYNNHSHAQAYAGYLDKNGHDAGRMHQGGGGGGYEGHYGHHNKEGMNHGHGGGHQGHYGHHNKEGMNHGHGGAGYGGHQGHYGNNHHAGGGGYGAHQAQYCPPKQKVSSVWEFKSIVD